MKKCKCIEIPQVELQGDLFTVGQFYNYEYIPSYRDKPALYRVYADLDNFINFELDTFSKHFKKYSA